jgi:hypothetical protein
MPRTRDPSFTTGHLCRFCDQIIPWGTIIRIIRTDPDTPGFMLNETAAHTECLAKVLRPEVELSFPRHWAGRAPLPDDDSDIFLPLDGGGQEGVTPEPRSTSAVTPPQPSAERDRPPDGLACGHSSRGGSRALRPCAICGEAIAPAELVRLRVQKPVGPVKRPEFDEQSLPVHFECLAKVSTMRFG